MPDLPPEPEKPKNMSDAQFKAWKKSHAQWSRMVRDAGSDPVRNEDEAIERAAQKGDTDFEKGIADLIGYSTQDIQEVYGSLTKDEIKSMSPVEREAFEAFQRANRAVFFKAGAQREAKRKMKKAKGDIKKRVSDKKGWCAVVAVAALLVGAFEIAMIVSGVVEVVQAVTP